MTKIRRLRKALLAASYEVCLQRRGSYSGKPKRDCTKGCLMAETKACSMASVKEGAACLARHWEKYTK